MRCIPIHTTAFIPPRDDLYAMLDMLDASLPRLRERDILFITSKVLAIHQGRCVKIAPDSSKELLIKKGAEALIPRRLLLFKEIPLTIKVHTLIPVAGVDALAAMAILLMGESAEWTPLLVMRGVPNVSFTTPRRCAPETVYPSR